MITNESQGLKLRRVHPGFRREPKQVFAPLPDTLEAVYPGKKPGVLKRLDRLGDGRTGAAGALGYLLI
jgi:hypothetical protein